jgi:zinc protease
MEPEQTGERRVHVHGEGETAYLMAAYRAPRATDPDFFPLTVLGSVLLGATGMSLMGGSSSNKSSRLYKALVDTDLAANVGGSTMPMIDPTLYSIVATARAGRTLDEVEGALNAEIEALFDDRPITEEELGKAIKRSKAAFAFNSESVTNQGLWLGFSELVAGSYGWFEDYVENLERVTLDEVNRVAAKYLNRRQRTMGWYVPENGPRVRRAAASEEEL